MRHTAATAEQLPHERQLLDVARSAADEDGVVAVTVVTSALGPGSVRTWGQFSTALRSAAEPAGLVRGRSGGPRWRSGTGPRSVPTMCSGRREGDGRGFEGRVDLTTGPMAEPASRLLAAAGAHCGCGPEPAALARRLGLDGMEARH